MKKFARKVIRTLKMLARDYGKWIVMLVIALIVGMLIGNSIGRKDAILNARIVDVTENEIYIDYGRETDDGYYYSEVHIYEYEH